MSESKHGNNENGSDCSANLILTFERIIVTRLAKTELDDTIENISPHLIITVGSNPVIPLFKTCIVKNTEIAQWDFNNEKILILNNQIVKLNSLNQPVLTLNNLFNNSNNSEFLSFYVEDNNPTACYSELGSHRQSLIDLIKLSTNKNIIIQSQPFKLKTQPLGIIEFHLKIDSKPFWTYLNSSNETASHNLIQRIDLIRELIQLFLNNPTNNSPFQYVLSNQNSLNNLLTEIIRLASNKASLNGEVLRKCIFQAILKGFNTFSTEIQQNLANNFVANNNELFSKLHSIRHIEPALSFELFIEQWNQLNLIAEKTSKLTNNTTMINGFNDLKEYLTILTTKYSSKGKAKELDESSIMSLIKDLENFYQIMQFPLQNDPLSQQFKLQQEQAANAATAAAAVLAETKTTTTTTENKEEIKTAPVTDNQPATSAVTTSTDPVPAPVTTTDNNNTNPASTPATVAPTHPDPAAFHSYNIMKLLTTDYVWLTKLVSTLYSKAIKFWAEEDSSNDDLLRRLSTALENFTKTFITDDARLIKRSAGRSASRKKKAAAAAK